MELNADSDSSFELNQPQSTLQHLSKQEEFDCKRQAYSMMFNQFDQELVSCRSELLAERAENATLMHRLSEWEEEKKQLY